MPLERSVQFIEQEHIVENAPRVYVMAKNATDALADQEKIERKGGIRLTHIMKSSILDKVYDFKFKKAGDALDRLELKLSHRAMVAAFGKANLELLAKIGPPYAHCGHTEDGARLNPEAMAEWKGTKVGWRVGALGYTIALYVKDPLPAHVGYGAQSRFVVKPGELADAIVAWQEACTEWSNNKREMQLKVNAVLNSVTTFTSLQKTWPAGERFFEHIPIEFPFRNQVPAVKVDDLNAALGL